MSNDIDLARDFLLASQRLERYMRDQFAEHVGKSDLNDLRIDALFVLDRCGAMKMAEFSHELDVRPSHATHIADRLVDIGLVGRIRNADDRRIVAIKLTVAGKGLVDALLTRAAEFLLSAGHDPLVRTIGTMNMISVAGGAHVPA